MTYGYHNRPCHTGDANRSTNLKGNNMNDQAIEQEIQAKGLTAPRVTLADIEANIIGESYFTAAQGAHGAALAKDGFTDPFYSPPEFGLLTFCVLVLRNGFTVTGESACSSPENFDAEIGRKIARDNAVRKLWPLMGYALKDRLHEYSGDLLTQFEIAHNRYVDLGQRIASSASE